MSKFWTWIKTAILKAWKAWSALDEDQQERITDTIEDIKDKIIKKKDT